MTLEYFLRWLCPKQLYAYSTKVRVPQSTIDFRKFLVARWLLNQGGSVIDGGAHIGYYTRYFSEMVEGKGTVYSFEPNPYMFRLLNKYARCRDNITPYQKALSNRAATCSFYVQPFTLSQDSNLEAGRPGQKKVQVQTVRLDDVIERSAAIKLIKLDVEGHELQALLGAERILQQCRPWVIFEYMQNGERNDQEVVQALQKWGYECVDLKDLRPLPHSNHIDLTDGVAFPKAAENRAIEFLGTLKQFT